MNEQHLKLRGHIKASGHTIVTLARKMGVSTSHLNNVLCGRSSPKLDLCYAIIDEVKADKADIYTLFPPEVEK